MRRQLDSVLRFRAAHKFSTKRVEIDGYKFQSQPEARRYLNLKLMESAGEIADLKVHPCFKIEHEGVDICTVVPDFAYIALREGGRVRYEDVKQQRIGRDGKVKYSTDTRHSRIGRKLLKAFKKIDVDILFA